MVEFQYFWLYLLLLVFLAPSAWLLNISWRTPSRRRRFAERATLLALALFASFVLIEGWFHCCVDVTDGAMAQLTSHRWAARHWPPEGDFRHPNAPEPPPAGAEENEICVLGDSLTNGQGIERVEDLYPSLLEGKLRAAGVPARVFNFSHQGWDTIQETKTLEGVLASGLRCRVLVLGYCLNDIEAYVDYPADIRKAAGRLTTLPWPVRPFAERSFLVSWLYNRWVIFTEPSLRRFEDAEAAAYRNPETFAAHGADLLRLKHLCDTYDVRLLVVTFPQINSPWPEYRYRDIHRRLGEFWAEQKIPMVDLLPEFERHPYRELQASAYDGHPNELAHRLVAQQVFARLVGLMGLPAVRMSAQ